MVRCSVGLSLSRCRNIVVVVVLLGEAAPLSLEVHVEVGVEVGWVGKGSEPKNPHPSNCCRRKSPLVEEEGAPLEMSLVKRAEMSKSMLSSIFVLMSMWLQESQIGVASLAGR